MQEGLEVSQPQAVDALVGNTLAVLRSGDVIRVVFTNSFRAASASV
jgi:hypothetical protein